MKTKNPIWYEMLGLDRLYSRTYVSNVLKETHETSATKYEKM